MRKVEAVGVGAVNQWKPGLLFNLNTMRRKVMNKSFISTVNKEYQGFIEQRLSSVRAVTIDIANPGLEPKAGVIVLRYIIHENINLDF